MSYNQKRIEELERKIARLRELKKRIEQRIKKERSLAFRYAKEVAFYYLETLVVARESEASRNDLAIEMLEQALCSRAKRKGNCLKKKLELLVEHGDEFPVVRNIARELLKHLMEKEES